MEVDFLVVELDPVSRTLPIDPPNKLREPFLSPPASLSPASGIRPSPGGHPDTWQPTGQALEGRVWRSGSCWPLKKWGPSRRSWPRDGFKGAQPPKRRTWRLSVAVGENQRSKLLRFHDISAVQFGMFAAEKTFNFGAEDDPWANANPCNAAVASKSHWNTM